MAKLLEAVDDGRFLAVAEHLRGTGEIFINNQYFTDVGYELETRGNSRSIVGQIYTLGHHPALLSYIFKTNGKTTLCLSDGRQLDFLIPQYNPPADCSDIAGTWLY